MRGMKISLIILIVINCIILIYLIFRPAERTYNYTSYAIKQQDIKIQNGELDDDIIGKPVRDNIINFENETILLTNYLGELTTGTVNVKFTDLLDFGFSKFYQDTLYMDIKLLKEYLEQNKNNIAMQVGITSIDDFSKFIQKIQIYKDENIRCEKIEIVENSYVNGNEYDQFKVQLTYNNGQALIFNVSLSNYDFIDTPLVIIK